MEKKFLYWKFTRMPIKYFMSPSWKNFLLMAALWYLGILIRFYIGRHSDITTLQVLQFYTKYSWPNFFLTYVVAIWIFPKTLITQKYIRFTIALIISLIVFMVVRYFNNTFLNETHYYQFFENNKLVKFTFGEIINEEFFKGMSMIYIGLTYASLMHLIVTSRKKRILEREKMQAELSLLRSQLNPHFLFNSINDIYYLSLIKSENTPSALMKLSQLMRYVLHEKADMVPLEKEIDYLKRLVDLHQLRFPEYMVDLNIDLGKNGFTQNIPPMLFSTFLENAFKHGAEGTSSNPVCVQLWVDENFIHYKVRNKVGQGISKDKISGIGLDNLQKRLGLLYPEKHDLALTHDDNYFTAYMKLYLK